MTMIFKFQLRSKVLSVEGGGVSSELRETTSPVPTSENKQNMVTAET